MSIQQSPATTRLPRIATPEKHSRSSQRPARQARLQKLILDVRQLHSVIGLAGAAILYAGAALAVLCALSAVQLGMPFPISIAAGYCTLACSACFCAALVLMQNFDRKAVTVAERPEPNYAAWKLASRLRISDASRLWCNIEPGCPATQDSLAWAQAMLNAIKAGELPICVRPGEGQDGQAAQDAIERERNNPSWATEIERHALRAWADSYGHAPRFLNV